MTYAYAHMCRDDHVQIGHNDSEHEMCPLCRARAEGEMMLELLKDIEADWPATTSVLRERGRALIAEAEANGQLEEKT